MLINEIIVGKDTDSLYLRSSRQNVPNYKFTVVDSYKR